MGLVNVRAIAEIRGEKICEPGEMTRLDGALATRWVELGLVEVVDSDSTKVDVTTFESEEPASAPAPSGSAPAKGKGKK